MITDDTIKGGSIVANPVWRKPDPNVSNPHAEMVATYWRGLIDGKVPWEVAVELTKDYQSTLLMLTDLPVLPYPTHAPFKVVEKP